VGEAGADVVPGAVERDLGFVLQGAEGGAVDDPFAVPLEFGAEIVGALGMSPAEAFLAAAGVGSKERDLFLFKIFPGADRHGTVMNDGMGESRDGEFSEEQGVKKGWSKGNKFISRPRRRGLAV
jgi:hypothetical protein